MSTEVVGSFGYSAPEFAMSGIYTAKSDVYSFGVVMLELLTGRMPLDRCLIYCCFIFLIFFLVFFLYVCVPNIGYYTIIKMDLLLLRSDIFLLNIISALIQLKTIIKLFFSKN